MTIETVRADAFEMDYCRFGQGKESFVILPGLALQSVMLFAEGIRAQYQKLAEQFTVYVFDRRKELPPRYSIRDMARDTAEALRTLTLGPACLFGVSQGGMIAMEITIEHPELVKRLILGSTSACVSRAQKPLFEGWVQLAREGRAEELYLSFGQALNPPGVFEKTRQLYIDAARTVTEEELRRFVILAGAADGFDVLDQLDRIQCPALVIGAKDDRVLGGDASVLLAEKLKNSQLCMYDGYGHAVYDLAPDYQQRLLQFARV